MVEHVVTRSVRDSAALQQRLEIARKALAHPGTKGDASESVWVSLLDKYLPQRYRASSGHVVDSRGKFSEQIDVLVFDRQYSPFLFQYEGQTIIPAESVYAAFEAKQTIDASLVEYAQKKVTSVRGLHRTSLPIPYAGGSYPPKTPPHILGGILSLESEWKPALGAPLQDALDRAALEGRLDLGCVAAHGTFELDEEGTYSMTLRGKPATAFLFELIARLQDVATVSMIDVRAYSNWLP